MNFGFFIILVQGYIAPEYYRFDGYLSPSMNLKFSDVPNGLKVQLRRWCRVIFIDFQRFSLGFNNMFQLYIFDQCQFQMFHNFHASFERFEPSWSWCSIVPPSIKALSVVPKEGWAQILAFAGFLELVVNKKTSEPGGIHAFRLAWVCLPLDIFLRQLWKGQPRPWPDRLRQLRPGSCDKDLPTWLQYMDVHGTTCRFAHSVVYVSDLLMSLSMCQFRHGVWYYFA